MLAALESPTWDTPERRSVLEFMCREILDNVVLPAGSRMCPGTRSLKIGDAFEDVVGEDVVTQHCGVPEASVLARLLARFRPRTDKGFLKKCMQARIATSIPQAFRARLANARAMKDARLASGAEHVLRGDFIRSICETRSSSITGKTVPIAGGEHPLESLENLLAPSDLDSIEMFCDQVLAPGHSVIAPGHSVIVAETVRLITNPAISSSAAVDIVRKASEVCLLEMAAGTAGTTPCDKCKFKLCPKSEELPFAPPFITPFGPSVHVFYAPCGKMIDMVDGAPPNLSPAELAEYIREKRKRLMAEHYKTPESGEVTRTSACSSLSRAMSDVALQMPHLLDDPARLVDRAVSVLIDRDSDRAGNVHERSLEARARALVPSLRTSMKRFSDPPKGQKVSLLTRLSMEMVLAGEEVPAPVRVEVLVCKG